MTRKQTKNIKHYTEEKETHFHLKTTVVYTVCLVFPFYFTIGWECTLVCLTLSQLWLSLTDILVTVIFKKWDVGLGLLWQLHFLLKTEIRHGFGKGELRFLKTRDVSDKSDMLVQLEERKSMMKYVFSHHVTFWFVRHCCSVSARRWCTRE